MRTSPVLAAAVALLAACDADDTAPRTVIVTAAVAPLQFRAGEPVAVTITARNDGRRPVRVEGEPCQDPFVLATAAGARVPPAGRVCPLILRPPRVIAPGDRLVITRSWRGDRGTEPPGGADPVALPPGEYGLQGVVRDADTGGTYAGSAVTVRVLP